MHRLHGFLTCRHAAHRDAHLNTTAVMIFFYAVARLLFGSNYVEKRFPSSGEDEGIHRNHVCYLFVDNLRLPPVSCNLSGSPANSAFFSVIMVSLQSSCRSVTLVVVGRFKSFIIIYFCRRFHGGR